MNIGKGKFFEIVILVGIGILTVEVDWFMFVKKVQALRSQPVAPAVRIQSDEIVSDDNVNPTKFDLFFKNILCEINFGKILVWNFLLLSF